MASRCVVSHENIPGKSNAVGIFSDITDCVFTRIMKNETTTRIYNVHSCPLHDSVRVHLQGLELPPWLLHILDLISFMRHLQKRSSLVYDQLRQVTDRWRVNFIVQ